LDVIDLLPGCKAFRQFPDALTGVADRQEEQCDGDGNGTVARRGARPWGGSDLPRHYGDWIAAQSPLADQFASEPRRREMAQDLITAQAETKARMEAGIELN
jgi:hypothetical protein